MHKQLAKNWHSSKAQEWEKQRLITWSMAVPLASERMGVVGSFAACCAGCASGCAAVGAAAVVLLTVAVGVVASRVAASARLKSA